MACGAATEGSERQGAVFLSPPTPRQLKKEKKESQVKVGESLPEIVTEGPLVSEASVS